MLWLLERLISGALEQHFIGQDLEILNGELAQVQIALREAQSNDDLHAIVEALKAENMQQNLALLVIAPDGKIINNPQNAQFPIEELQKHAAKADNKSFIAWLNAKNRRVNGSASLIETNISHANKTLIAVANDSSHNKRFIQTFRNTLGVIILFAALLIGILSSIIVRNALEPLKTIRQKAEKVTVKRLNMRLALHTVPPELFPLVDTLNEMFSRLEESFQRLSDFSSDLAHELRTPISNALTQTQVTLTRTRDASEYRDVLASNVEEFERLSRLITDMLFIAKAENGQLIPNQQAISLEKLVGTALEFHRLLAEEKNIVITQEGEALIKGDDLMLSRAVCNLLSNAVRHTDAGGQINVRIQSTLNSAAQVSVENTGKPIDKAHLPRLFDRFYRANADRQTSGENSGLGLSIVKSIMNAHGGDISAEAQEASNTFTLHFPK